MNWGLLVRISDDRTGEAAGVERQEADGRAEVRRRGGTVAEVYRENDTSAFKRKLVTLPDGTRGYRVIRPEYRRALADLADGRIDGLMVYDLDRLTRDARDLEDAIDVAEQTGRPIAAVTGSVDLASDHGITSARMLVAVANKASRDTSRRVKRVHLQLAEQGRPSGGRRPYGYTADRLHVVPEEAEVLRELAGRRLAGEGWIPLARSLNERGIPAASGGTWTLSNIRSALLKPHIAGLRSLKGHDLVPAVWPAILDRDTWEQLRALAGEYNPPTRRYLLSGIACCALCDHGLVGTRLRSVPAYRCPPLACGGITRRAAGLDGFVVGYTLRLLADLDLTPPAPPADRELAAELAAKQRRRASVVAAFADVDAAEPVELRRALARLDADIARLQARAQTDHRVRLLRQVQGITAEEWEARPLDVRRAVLATLLESVRVGRSARGRVPFDSSSVEIVPAPVLPLSGTDSR